MLLQVRHKPVEGKNKSNASSFSHKSFNNLSIDNPERELMDMHYRTKR